MNFAKEPLPEVGKAFPNQRRNTALQGAWARPSCRLRLARPVMTCAPGFTRWLNSRCLVKEAVFLKFIPFHLRADNMVRVLLYSVALWWLCGVCLCVGFACGGRFVSLAAGLYALKSTASVSFALKSTAFSI